MIIAKRSGLVDCVNCGNTIDMAQHFYVRVGTARLIQATCHAVGQLAEAQAQGIYCHDCYDQACNNDLRWG